MKLSIRPEKPEDISSIYALNKSAFGQDNEARLVDALRESDVFIPELSLVAEMNDEIVGHILFTRLKIVSGIGIKHESLALAPMAVSPDRQRQGIGTELVVHGLAKSKELGFDSVILLGHKEYYPRFGFVPASRWNIKAPFDCSDAVFMALELKQGSLTDVSGTVEYPPEFSEEF